MPAPCHPFARPARRVALLALACAVVLASLVVRAGAAQAAGHDIAIGTAATSGVTQATVGATTTFTATADGARLRAGDLAAAMAAGGVTRVVVDTGAVGGDAGAVVVTSSLAVPSGKALSLQSSASSGSVTTGAFIDGPGTLELRAATVAVANTIGVFAPPAAITVSGPPGAPAAGVAHVDGFLTAGALAFAGAVDFPGSVQLQATAGDATFTGSVDGPGNLDVSAPTGDVLLAGGVGAVEPVASATVATGGSITVGGAGARAVGTLDLDAPTTTWGAGAVTLESTAGHVQVGGTLDGAGALTLSSVGGSEVEGAIGAVTPPAALVGAGPVELGAVGAVTGGDQQWGGAVTIDDDIVLRSTGGDITLGAGIDAIGLGCTLDLDADDAVRLPGGVGTHLSVDVLTVDGAAIELGAGARSQHGQTWNAPITLTGDATLASSIGGAITLPVVGGAHALGVDNPGATTLGGAIGSPAVDPTSITFAGTGPVAGSNVAVTTSGAIVARGALTGITTLRSTGGGLDATAAVTPPAGATIDVATASTISGSLGGTTWTKSGAGTLRLLGSDTATGTVTVGGGGLRADGADHAAVALAGTTLTGSGSVGATTTSGGTIEPGSAVVTGVLGLDALTARGATTLQLHVTPSGAQSQLRVVGALDLGTTTTLSLDLQHVFAVGTTLRLVDHAGALPVVGAFVGLPAGAEFHDVPTDTWYRIDYDGGDGNDVVVTRQPIATTLDVGASPAPSGFGATVTFHARVSSIGVAPTGTVAFREGARTLCTATLVGASGAGSCANAGLAVGTHAIDAEYSGDDAHAGATATPFDQVVGRGVATVAVTASPSPATVGAPVTLVAGLAAPGATPTGTVTFADGATTLGTATLAGGEARLTTATLGAGHHDLTASWGGDADRLPATGSATLEVGTIATATRLVASPTTVVAGAPVTLFATVTGTSPTGSVTVRDGDTVLADLPLVGGGASLTTTTLAVGDHALRADYRGDTSHAASSSTAAVVHVSAPPAAPPAAPLPSIVDVVPPRPAFTLPVNDRLSRGGSLVLRVSCPRTEETCTYVGLLSSSLRHHALHGREVDPDLVAAQVVTVRGGRTAQLKLHLVLDARMVIAERPTRAVLRMVVSDAAGNVTRVKRVVLLHHG